MATRDELLALADRCEREEPGRFLDAKIELLFVEHDGQAFPHPDGWVLGGRAQPVKARPFTTSLDAAVTLVPESAGAYCAGKAATAVGHCFASVDNEECWAKTPALALCAAALKARAERLL